MLRKQSRLALRMVSKPPLKVLDLCCGTSEHPNLPVLNAIIERKRGRSVEYYGINKSEPWFKEREKRQIEEGVNAAFYEERLSFQNPEGLKEILKKRFGDEKFDEIHFHVPDPVAPMKFHSEKNAAEILEIIKGRLKDGGKFSPSFDNATPFVHEDKTFGKIEEIKPAIRRLAESAGLELNALGKCMTVHVPKLDGTGREWRGEWQVEIGGRPLKNLNRVSEVPAYTKFSGMAKGFFVLRKPKKT